MKHAIVMLALFLGSLPLRADDKDALLTEGVKMVHAMWTEVVGKPKLEYDSISRENLKTHIGTWRGPFINPRSEKPELVFELKQDGTWASRIAGPNLDEDDIADSEQSGNWYWQSGMILLYDAPAAKDEEVSSALMMKNGKLRLLAAMMKQGFVELTKQK